MVEESITRQSARRVSGLRDWRQVLNSSLQVTLSAIVEILKLCISAVC